MTASATPLGQLLIDRGLIAAEDLDRALELQRERGDKIGKILVDMGYLAQRDLFRTVRTTGACPSPQIAAPPSGPEIEGYVAAIPPSVARFPLAIEEGALTLAMADPLDFETINAVQGFSKLEVTPAARHRTGNSRRHRSLLHRGRSPVRHSRFCRGDEDDLEHLRDMASEAPVIRLVNAMIAQAVEKRASDIHIEPFEKEFRIRFRIDGVLFNQEQPPRELKAAIISRLKLMAKLNIAERRLPQDGRIKLRILGREVDLRVSTLPTLFGESVVMRLLDRSAGDFYDLRRLGFDDHMLARMEYSRRCRTAFSSSPDPPAAANRPRSIPRSSASTCPIKRSSPSKIPVEYQMDGINQIHVNPQIGLTFAAGIRHIVRQDPDVIMIGEIRDRETADIAIRSALTGHFVFSTLHTNDAPSAVTRLTDMGVENYLITSSVVAVLAQRLVRVICAHCKESAALAHALRRCVESSTAAAAMLQRLGI